MTNRIDKILLRLSDEERDKLKSLFVRIQNHDFTHLDMRKLKGHENIFRVRLGKMRVIFRVDATEEIYIIAVERRSDTTYNF